MRGVLVASVWMLVFAVVIACSSAEEDSGPAVAQVADLSQFPTPTQSQAQPRSTAQPQQNQNVGDTSEAAPMTQEEVQQLRQQLQSGQLSEEEAQQAIQQLRAQFGGGQGGPPFGGAADNAAVGPIESIGENTITIEAELTLVTATVGEDTNVRVTSVLEREALTSGVEAMVFSERVEGSTIARVVTVIPEGEGQGAFGGGLGGQGRFGGEQGGGGPRALAGTVEDVTDTDFLLETQQGPLPITLDDESVVIRTRQGTIDDLEVRMIVRVVGSADEDGRIDARSVTVTPEGMDEFSGFGGGRGPGDGN